MDLESRLRQARQEWLVIAGGITSNSVEATVRMAGNWAGTYRAASEVHAMSPANLDAGYCTVICTRDVLAAVMPE